MASSAKLSDLSDRHQALERQIQIELAHPSPDTLKISELKRAKLKLKDQLTELEEDVQVKVA